MAGKSINAEEVEKDEVTLEPPKIKNRVNEILKTESKKGKGKGKKSKQNKILPEKLNNKIVLQDKQRNC